MWVQRVFPDDVVLLIAGTEGCRAGGGPRHRAESSSRRADQVSRTVTVSGRGKGEGEAGRKGRSTGARRRGGRAGQKRWKGSQRVKHGVGARSARRGGQGRGKRAGRSQQGGVEPGAHRVREDGANEVGTPEAGDRGGNTSHRFREDSKTGKGSWSWGGGDAVHSAAGPVPKC